MTNTIFTRTSAITLLIAGLSASFGAVAQEAATRVSAAQNGGTVATDTTPKFNPGLNGRVKPAEAKPRAQVAQNGGDASTETHVQPKYNSALSGRAMAAPVTMANSAKEATTTD